MPYFCGNFLCQCNNCLCMFNWFLISFKKVRWSSIFLSCYSLSNLRCNLFFNLLSSFWRGGEHVYLSLKTTWSQLPSFLSFHLYLITLGFKTMWLENKKITRKYLYNFHRLSNDFWSKNEGHSKWDLDCQIKTES